MFYIITSIRDLLSTDENNYFYLSVIKEKMFKAMMEGEFNVHYHRGKNKYIMIQNISDIDNIQDYAIATFSSNNLLECMKEFMNKYMMTLECVNHIDKKIIRKYFEGFERGDEMTYMFGGTIKNYILDQFNWEDSLKNEEIRKYLRENHDMK